MKTAPWILGLFLPARITAVPFRLGGRSCESLVLGQLLVQPDLILMLLILVEQL